MKLIFVSIFRQYMTVFFLKYLKAQKISLNRKSETDNFLIQPIKDDYSFKWNRLLFEDKEPFIFHDTKLNLENEVIFDLWENSFDT